MNNVVLIGRLTRDPELKYTQNNRAMCNLYLAVDRGYSKQKKMEMESQNLQTADFPRVVVWGQQAENSSRYLRKGSQCAVTGRIQTGRYQDNNGNIVYTTDVVADRVEFLSTNNSQGYSNYQNNSMNQDTYRDNFNQDLPTNNYQDSQNNKEDDDYFGDDFSEIEDDGRIPF